LQKLATLGGIVVLCALGAAPRAAAGDAPAWMHALVNAPLPAHDDKTDAVLLYSERILTVHSPDKMKLVVREAYRILRPGGRHLGFVVAYLNSERKITGMRGWSIPAQGKDFEVKDKEAIEAAIPDVDGSELVSDARVKLLRIPGSEPGNIVGYEYEEELRPFLLQFNWPFQAGNPVREARYTLQLPPGWEYKASWLNYAEVKPVAVGSNTWKWELRDVKELRDEDAMPPERGVAGEMFLSLFPPGGGPNRGFSSWKDIGVWYSGLTSGRRDPSAEIKQKVAALTAAEPDSLAKMRALARFAQRDVRYVAIELGIGGHQPHSASEVFTHRYGDCKDKATILSSMLHEVGVDSYYVVINARRGSVTPEMPVHDGFNHVILAVQLPESVADPSLVALMKHPKYGRILFFDPTNEVVPFGQLPIYLQANYGLLVTPDGGELTELPRLPPETNGIQRTAKLTLETSGALRGDVHEVRLGAAGMWQRMALRNVSRDADKVKPIETELSHSLATYHLTKATVGNFDLPDQPFVYNYSFVADYYGKHAGNLLLVRPRVIGSKSAGFLDTKEPRKYPVDFEGLRRDTDTFEITLPLGYEVDDLPPPVNEEHSFASYHSKTEVNGNVLRFTRTWEIKQLSVPLEKVDELKRLYHVIASDERNTAVLKPAGSH
jgi:transglutaminase-like putative cysteine protease